MAQVILDPPQELIAELERRAAKSSKSIPDFVREEPKRRNLQRQPERKRGDIPYHPEVWRAIQLQEDTRRRLEGRGYSGSAVVHEMRGQVTWGEATP